MKGLKQILEQDHPSSLTGTRRRYKQTGVHTEHNRTRSKTNTDKGHIEQNAQDTKEGKRKRNADFGDALSLSSVVDGKAAIV